ncbi:MAG: hypothetical protein PF590_05280 [Candidatus Delongbacteria bacterium]|jgi:hypothetical protein|nr:hypothetical protein [Candidatus Delongbacteria bacterium]
MQLSDDKTAASVMELLRNFNKNAKTDAGHITACTLPVDDYFFE